MQIFLIITLLFFVIAIIISIIIMKFTYDSEMKLKKVSEKISDGYIILNKSLKVTNYNKTFLKFMNLQEKDVYRKNIKNFLKKTDLAKDTQEKILNALNSIENKKSIKFIANKKSKIYDFEIMNLVDNDVFMRYVVLIKDVTQNYKTIEELKSNQEVLANRERLATLRWVNNRYSSFS